MLLQRHPLGERRERREGRHGEEEDRRGLDVAECGVEVAGEDRCVILLSVCSAEERAGHSQLGRGLMNLLSKTA